MEGNFKVKGVVFLLVFTVTEYVFCQDTSQYHIMHPSLAKSGLGHTRDEDSEDFFSLQEENETNKCLFSNKYN